MEIEACVGVLSESGDAAAAAAATLRDMASEVKADGEEGGEGEEGMGIILGIIFCVRVCVRACGVGVVGLDEVSFSLFVLLLEEVVESKAPESSELNRVREVCVVEGASVCDNGAT